MGHTYQFKALPFGLSSAPWFISMAAREFCLRHSQPEHSLASVPGFIQAMSMEICVKHRDLVLLLCDKLGQIVNQEKSELIPAVGVCL